MGLAVGHSAQSVFAKVTNTKEKKFLSKLSGLKHEEDRVNVYFVILPGLRRLLPSTSALICEYQVCTPKLNCCLFYSAGVKASACRWMLSGEWGSQDARLCCWHNTIPERPTAWFSQAKCHGNCEDLYQWEKSWRGPAAIRSDRLNMCSNVACHTKGLLQVDQFYRVNAPPPDRIDSCKSSVKWNF